MKNSWLVLLALLLAGPVQAELRVVSSIKPLQLLVAALGGDRVENQVLLPPGVSPHSYALRFSDMRKLQQADLVLWIGPELELFLQRPLKRLEEQRVLTLGVGQEQSQPPHGHHEHGGENHPWLSIKQSRRMAALLRDALIQADPAHKATYTARHAQFLAQLAQLEQQLFERLGPLRQQGFIAYHDAYRGVVEHFGLNQVDVVTLSPERQPGLRHIQQLRARVSRGEVCCLLIEPGISPRFVEMIAQDQPLTVVTLDPLAQQHTVTPQAYVQFLSELGGQLVTALGKNREGSR